MHAWRLLGWLLLIANVGAALHGVVVVRNDWWLPLFNALVAGGIAFSLLDEGRK